MAHASFSWDTLGPFLVWQFLIPFAASWTQSILYAIFIRAGSPKPLPGSPRYALHRRNILIALYLFYFAFSLYEADDTLQRQGSAYTSLGVPPDVSASALQSRFRRLTQRFHPDKVAEKDRDAASDFYVHLKLMREVLSDPVKRFAYDRFGMEGLARCAKCLTTKEHVESAVIGALGTYGAVGVFLVGANALGFLKDGAYWRYLALLAVASLEVRTAMRPDHPALLTRWVNPLVVGLGWRPAYVPFQMMVIVRKAAVSAAQFLGLLMPLWRDYGVQRMAPTDDSEEARHRQLDRLDGVVQAGNMDVTRILELESVAFRENEAAKGDLRNAMKKYMVQNVVHQEKDVRNAIGQSLGRRRAGVPHGAVGTK